jgi:hypothetical protein
MQATIIDAIAAGDPDVRQILNLVRSDPMSDWTEERVLEKPQPSDVNFDGIEVLTHSRIYDLRRWYPDEESPDRRGHVYVRDRITLQFLHSYTGDGLVTLQAPVAMQNLVFRQPNEELRGTISRIVEPVEVQGQERTVYEFAYDLSQLPPEEPATIEVEVIGDVPKTVRAPFKTHTKTDLISVWLLFPADRPYRTYSLVSYPADRSEAPRPTKSRYVIDHPYGSLCGWSVVNPEEDRIYECRWTTE